MDDTRVLRARNRPKTRITCTCQINPSQTHFSHRDHTHSHSTIVMDRENKELLAIQRIQQFRQMLSPRAPKALDNLKRRLQSN